MTKDKEWKYERPETFDGILEALLLDLTMNAAYEAHYRWLDRLTMLDLFRRQNVMEHPQVDKKMAQHHDEFHRRMDAYWEQTLGADHKKGDHNAMLLQLLHHVWEYNRTIADDWNEFLVAVTKLPKLKLVALDELDRDHGSPEGGKDTGAK